MEKEILVDEKIFPSNDILYKALNASQFNLYLDFLDAIKQLSLVIEWRFYNDAKTWLGKLSSKNKNFGWLSIWNIGFKVTVFFNERTLPGLNDLQLNHETSIFTSEVKAFGKLLPIRTTIDTDKKLADIIKIIDYKMKIK